MDIQIRDLDASITSQFNDLQKIPYRLQSVFVHRGYHNAGHYWIYVYDFSQDLWRKYNDGYVTELSDTSEIFEQEPGERPATPYFLVYVQEEHKDDLVNSVCREPMETIQANQEDVVMEDHSQAVELPATTPIDPEVAHDSQEYGVTERYNDRPLSYQEAMSAWNNSTAKAPEDGW